MPDSFILTYKH